MGLDLLHIPGRRQRQCGTTGPGAVRSVTGEYKRIDNRDLEGERKEKANTRCEGRCGWARVLSPGGSE